MLKNLYENGYFRYYPGDDPPRSMPELNPYPSGANQLSATGGVDVKNTAAKSTWKINSRVDWGSIQGDC